MPKQNRTIVIGSGFGGIAAALRMRARGDDVTIIERLDQLGGRARVFERDGFRHDAGPTVITAPFLFDELFALFGEKRSDHISFVPLDPWYRFYFDSTGDQFDYRATVEDTITEIKRFSDDDAEGYRKLLAASEKIFDVGFRQLADQPFDKLTSMLAQIPSLMRLKSHLTVSQMVNRYMKHDLMRQAFSIHPLLVGGNPFNTTSIYALIHFLEREWGVHFAMGGTGALVAALRGLMERHGITIRFNTDISRININNRLAQSVTTSDGEVIEADRVICNADPPTVYQQMIDPAAGAKGKIIPDSMTRYSMGLFVLYFGTKRTYPDVAHHTIWMGERYKALLHDIFNKKILAEDFSLYLHRPTATDKSFAPDGMDSFYVLCPVPNTRGNQNWDEEAPALRNRIVAALDRTIMPGLAESITSDFWMTPDDFTNDYRSMHGAGFSIAPVFTQSAWFRYHNRDRRIGNLYFSAAGAHPGAGMPGVLCSAKVVENLVIRDESVL
ncbi:MAG: phytoene desaturase family protein [Candidatus Puniceispirillales bacterium]|nr:phytoene desaturase family protein [Pseudomonadota bacterium]